MPEVEGWFQDPWARHDARWFSDGKATSLVRDGRREGNDPPPESGPQDEQLVRADPEPQDGESPERVFRGLEFERDFKGSLGYGQADPPPPNNWTDRLIIPVVTFLRPSQFGKPGYWRHVLWTVVLAWAITAAVLLLALR